MTRYRTGNHWGVTIVREGEDVVHLIADGNATTTCCGKAPFELARRDGHRLTVEQAAATCPRRPGDQLVAIVVNGDPALTERICELLNAGETGGPRSVLGDLIVMHGPYVAGQHVTHLLAGVVDLTEINALRDELIALRAIATGGSA